MKVLWSEGMFLTPQHFQQWESCLERSSWNRLRSVLTMAWGVAELILSPAELASGTVVIKSLRCVLPDGTAVEIPEVDDAPAARTLPEGGMDQSVGLYLTLPEAIPGRTNVHRVGKGDDLGRARYAEEIRQVEDETGPGESQKISFSRRNLKLQFEGEPSGGLIQLKLAEFARDESGNWAVSPSYVPPCLNLGASGRLVSIVEALQATLSAKRTALAEQRKGLGGGRLEFTASDVLGFWFLHTLNGTIPRLAHCLAHKQLGPDRAFVELVSLAGQLCTFSDEHSPTELPSYRGDDLFGCFSAVDTTIREMLEVVIPTDHVSIPLQKVQATIWQGTIPPDPDLDHAQYFLALCGESVAGGNPEEFIRGVKMASSDAIKVVLRAALPGVELRHVPRPPPSVPSRRDAAYFRVLPQGEYWRQVLQSRVLAMHIPEPLADLTPELVAVKR